MMFRALVRREKPPRIPVSASVDIHPYRLPFANGGSLKGWEGSLEVYQAALVALREAGAPDDARVIFREHRGYFGDRGNMLIEAICADWTDAPKPEGSDR